MALPLATFFAAMATAVFALVGGDRGLHGGSLVLAVITVSLLAARQGVAVLDNRLLATKVEAAYAQLKEMEASRTQMLHNIAHDLMSPLSPIQLQVHMLEHGAVAPTPEQTRAYAVIRRSGDRIRRLVEDLRDLGRIERGKLKLEPRPTDLRDLAEGVVEMHRPEAKERAIELAFCGDRDLVAVVDPERVGQILTNLVTNALKFTPAGGRVDVSAARADGNLEVTVRDTGRGLTPGEAARLFRPFVQVHDRAEIKERGTGLGLYISKGLAEQHGGTVAVASAGVGHGSAFTLRLPVAPPHVTALTVPARQRSPA